LDEEKSKHAKGFDQENGFWLSIISQFMDGGW
jgi:hypothetical protein